MCMYNAPLFMQVNSDACLHCSDNFVLISFMYLNLCLHQLFLRLVQYRPPIKKLGPKIRIHLNKICCYSFAWVFGLPSMLPPVFLWHLMQQFLNSTISSVYPSHPLSPEWKPESALLGTSSNSTLVNNGYNSWQHWPIITSIHHLVPTIADYF